MQVAQPAPQPFQESLVQGLFPRQGAFSGGKHLVLELLQLRRDIALRALEGLAAHIVRWHLIRLVAIDLDGVAVDPVVGDAQIGQTRALALAGLEFQQKVIGVGGEVPQFVEFGVIPHGQDATLADQGRRVLDEGPPQQLQHLGMGTGIPGQALEEGCLPRGQQGLQGWQERQGIPQHGQVAGPGTPQGNAGENAFQVPHAAEFLLERPVALLFQQLGHGDMALAYRLDVPQGPCQPAP